MISSHQNKLALLRVFDLPEDYIITKENNLQTNASYVDLMKILFADCYGQSNFLTKALNNADYISLDIIPNLKTPQHLWAKEYGCDIDEKNWKLSILFSQISYYSPEIILFAGWNYGFNLIKELKIKFNFVKKFVFWVGESLPSPEFYQYYDAIITCDQRNIPILKKTHTKVFQIYHAFEPKINNYLNESYKKKQILFAGTIKQGINEHSYRAEILQFIYQNFTVDYYGQTFPKPLFNTKTLTGILLEEYFDFLNYISKFGGKTLKLFPRYKHYTQFKEEFTSYKNIKFLQNKFKPAIYGLEYLQKIKESQIVLNTHGSTPYASNMRLFEVPGVGSCLLTDKKQNLSELFVDEKEILSYDSKEDLISKLTYLYNNPKVAHSIGIAGQKKIENQHTYNHRISDYLKAFHKILNEK